MQHKPISFALLTALTACAGQPRPVIAPYAVASGARPRPVVLERAIDPCLRIVGLASLAEVELPQGYRELRLTGGPGMILGEDYPVVRVLASPQGVQGEVVRCWGYVDSTTHEIHHRALRARPSRPVNWARLFAHLDSLGASTLQSPKHQTVVFDAGDLIVEIRDGARYRAYEVNAPTWRADSLGRQAARIKAVVDSMNRLTRGY